MKKSIPYAVANYEELVQKNSYFVDKTHYIEKLEGVSNPIFLRPRRFGKSLWCRMLELYYSILHKDEFNQLFGHTYIGRHPTPRRNSYLVLHFDFSTIDPGTSTEEIEANFNYTCNLRMRTVMGRTHKWFQSQRQEEVQEDVQEEVVIDLQGNAASNLELILESILLYELPPLYVIIDEYDNFANQLIMANQDQRYLDLTDDDSFLKTFFKTLKEGRKTGAIANIFIIGVLPVTMDELASAFKVSSFLTLHPTFEQMLGFTETEVNQLLDQIYLDYEIDPATRAEVDEVIKNYYDGYYFVSTQDEALYNSTILMYFLKYFTEFQTIPKRLIDLNLKTDLSWVRRLTASNPALTEEFVNQLTFHNNIDYDDILLVEKFDMYQFFEKSFFPISFFYLGMLTKRDDFTLQLPNLTMRQIFIEYFNEIHRIDVSTRYAKIMQTFINQPDLEQLFAGYWQEYVAQLPEAIFTQVNENFYCTTFFELCSRHLSRWFTWNVERSYPKGKSDLEFVGKYHEKFAGLRWVIEFKYYSNAAFNRTFKTSIADFTLPEEDTVQINGYVEGLRAEYPDAQIAQFVIYCIGNQGFRVFPV